MPLLPDLNILGTSKVTFKVTFLAGGGLSVALAHLSGNGGSQNFNCRFVVVAKINTERWQAESL